MKKEKKTGFFGDLGDPNNPINIFEKGNGEFEKGNGEEISSETKFCSNCGAKIDAKAEICPKCGVRVRDVEMKTRSPGLAAVLSFFILGLGQIYNGDFLVAVGLWMAEIISILMWLTSPVFIIFSVAIWIGGILDAYYSPEEQKDIFLRLKRYWKKE